MVLTRFFKPKWQHSDPEVRHQAVQALTSADTDILSRIAIEDEAPAVRRLALGRLDDLDSMQKASEEDNDRDIRQFARTRLSELLAGIRKESPVLDVRVDFLSRHMDTELLEFVALNGVEPEFRKSAQDSVTREAVLHDIAIRDALLANRQAALERITDPSILEAIMQQARKRDKQVYRQSRLRLDAIREAQERPARIKAECEQICTAIEAMGQGDTWQEELKALPGLEERWQAIKDEAGSVYQARYELTREAFKKASAIYCEAREAEQRKWAVIQACRQALLTQVAHCKTQLLDTQDLSAETETGYTAELKSWQTAWSEAGDLPAAQTQPLDDQFVQDTNTIRQRLAVLQRNRQMEKALQSLLEEAGRLMGSKRPVLEQEVKSLERRWKEQYCPADPGRLAEDLQRFEGISKQLRKRLSHQREQRRSELERLPGMLEQLDVLLKQKTLKEAGPLHDRIESSINHLLALGVSREKLGTYTRKLHSMTPQVLELKSWRSWGADEARQRLCAEMEALIGSETQPNELATGIRHLRSEWDQLRSDGDAGFNRLRKRFDKAASEAYKPCEIYFKKQQEKRNSNLEVKHALLQRLEAFLASADWSDMDWKIAVKFQRQISNDWRRAGPVDRRKSKELETKYHNGLEELNERVAMERQHNLVQRNALIEQVRELLNIEDINRAIDECKRLQARWQTTVSGTRQQENSLWQEFREACDAVFLRRKQHQDAHHETEKQNKAHKQQLCEQLEELTKCTIAELDDAERQFRRISGEWKAPGPVAKRDSSSLDKRFEKARHAFQGHAEALREADAQAQLEQLQKKAGYCMEVEQLLEHLDPAVARASLEVLEERWIEVLPLKDDATELAIQTRYEKAKHALLEGGEQRDQLVSELRVNLSHRKELCLRMEILAGVESPPEVHQARLEFQVNRLAEAIGQGSGDKVGKMAEIQHEWYLSGGAPVNQEKILQGRFEKACQGLKSQ